MGSRLRSSTLLFSLAAIAFALLVGAVISLSGGSISGGGQLDWPPPAPAALTATARAAQTPTPLAPIQVLATLAAPTSTTPATVAPATVAATAPMPTKQPAATPTAVAPTAAPATATAPAPPTAHTSDAANATIPTSGINLRSGPGTSFYVIATSRGGEQFTATGRSEDSQWVQLCCVGPARVWASVDYVELTGELNAQPVVAP